MNNFFTSMLKALISCRTLTASFQFRYGTEIAPKRSSSSSKNLSLPVMISPLSPLMHKHHATVHAVQHVSHGCISPCQGAKPLRGNSRVLHGIPEHARVAECDREMLTTPASPIYLTDHNLTDFLRRLPLLFKLRLYLLHLAVLSCCQSCSGHFCSRHLLWA